MSDQNAKALFDADSFMRAYINGWVVDGRAGGLIVGRRHAEGHIILIRPSDEIGVFEFCGVAEGGEYLMSTSATAAEFQKIRELNEFRDACESEIFLGLHTKLVHTSAERHDKLLIVDRQYIVNRRATRKHFEELEIINNRYPTTSGRLFDDGQVAAIEGMTFVDGPK